MPQNFYEVLGVLPTASVEEIKGKYRKLARWYHPDGYVDLPLDIRALAEQRMREVNEAYTVLSDGVKRVQYNRANGLDQGGIAVGEEPPSRWDTAHVEGVFASAEEMKRYTGFTYGAASPSPTAPAPSSPLDGADLQRRPRFPHTGKRIRVPLYRLGEALFARPVTIVLFLLALGITVLAVVELFVSMERGVIYWGPATALLMFGVSVLLVSVARNILRDQLSASSL